MQNEVVKSCAGSGKTHGLISRLSALLLGGAEPGEVLAITFTRKAAAEIYRRLLQRLREENTPEAEKVLRRVMLRETPRDDLTISTFHSWFMTLAENRPWSPSEHLPARLYDDKQQPLADIIWRRWLKKTESQPLTPALQLVLSHLSPSALQKVFSAFGNKLNAWRLYDDGGGRQKMQTQQAQKTKAAAEDTLRKVLASFDGGDVVGETARQIAANEIAPEDGREVFLTKTNTIRVNLTKSENTRAVAEAYYDFWLAFENAAAAQFNEAALIVCRDFAAQMHEYKRAENIITFDDLEYLAWRAVVDERIMPDITYRLSRKYRHLLIDEFQDTNPMQWAVVQKWLWDAHGSDDSPSVYIVGDRKQAIYGFRHGDAKLLDEAADFLQKYYPPVEAKDENQCRRCAPPVLDVVNAVFDGTMEQYQKHKPAAGVNDGLPGHVAFVITGAEGKKAKTRVKIRHPLKAEEDDSTKRQQWAMAVADAAANAIGKWQIKDGDKTRPCNGGDIMILLRQMTHADSLVRELAKYGIGCITSGGNVKLADRFAAADLLDVAAVLLFPGRDLPLARALKSPLFLLTDDELQHIAAGRGENTLWNALMEKRDAKDSTPAIKRAADLLQQWRNRARNAVLPAADLLHSIIAEGDVFARYVAASPHHLRGQVCADINALLDASLATDDGNRPLLAQFCQSANNLPAPEAAGGSNAVRLYTVHKAKGLQSPVVILADSDFDKDGGKGDSADVFAEWKAGEEKPRQFVIRPRTYKHAFADAAEAAKQQKAKEEENLFYVAMTRAQQALMVFALSEPKIETPAGRMLTAMKTLADGGDDKTGMLTYGKMPKVESVPPQLSPKTKAAKKQTANIGKRRPQTPQIIRGRALHQLIALMLLGFDKSEAAKQTGASPDDAAAAQKTLSSPQLQKILKESAAFFVETDIADGGGKVVRPDLLITGEKETWVIDYKSGAADISRHRAQLQTYRKAAEKLYPQTTVRTAILAPDGTLKPAD
ncbi:MAG: UvrD-helicase domain-containing protein [Gammaproteobacteria bacterium]